MNDDFYRNLLEKWCAPSSDQPPFICAFRQVRDIPYGSTGDRDPKIIVRNNLGSCSGKHILLHYLFRELGIQSRIITCLHYFDQALPLHNDYPDELDEIIRQHRVIDFHHFLKCKIGTTWVDVDVTWDQPLKDFGFPVNLDWDGSKNTTIAVKPVQFFEETEDVIGLKKKLIADVAPEDQLIRSRFLTLLTQWLKEIRTQNP